MIQQSTPVRIRLCSERYEVAASLFDTVFRQANGMTNEPPADVSADEEMLLGILEDPDSAGGYFVKPADPDVLRALRDRDETTPAADSGLERLELFSEGVMTRTLRPDGAGETVAISYDETELTGMEGAHSIVTFSTDDPGLVSLIRSGSVTTALTFRSHTRAICVYETPYMPFQVGIHCLTVTNRLEEEGILTLDYIIEIRGGCAERCRMEMSLNPSL